jgi:hypothetical protein
MITIPSIVLKMLMTNIIEAIHSLTDGETNARATVGTIEEKTLRMAAITAVQIAVGDVVWPSDKTIVFKEGPRQHGVFRIER